MEAGGGRDQLGHTATIPGQVVHRCLRAEGAWCFTTVGTLQITCEGDLRQEAWGSQWPSISRWATTVDIPINPPPQT